MFLSSPFILPETMTKLTFVGHATFTVSTDDGTKLVVDPFLSDNPQTDLSVADMEADYVLLTHGHHDHVGDVLPLLERTRAKVIATYELASYMEGRGFQASPHHIGGAVHYPFGTVKMVAALHGGKVDLPGGEAFSTIPCGFVVDLSAGGSGRRIYFAGDTGLTMEMRLLRGMVDVATLPIGDRFTMGPEDAVRAVEFIRPEVVIPFHYDSWPEIEQDPEAFREAVGNLARVEILEPGGSLELLGRP